MLLLTSKSLSFSSLVEVSWIFLTPSDKSLILSSNFFKNEHRNPHNGFSSFSSPNMEEKTGKSISGISSFPSGIGSSFSPKNEVRKGNLSLLLLKKSMSSGSFWSKSPKNELKWNDTKCHYNFWPLSWISRILAFRKKIKLILTVIDLLRLFSWWNEKKLRFLDVIFHHYMWFHSRF